MQLKTLQAGGCGSQGATAGGCHGKGKQGT